MRQLGAGAEIAASALHLQPAMRGLLAVSAVLHPPR